MRGIAAATCATAALLVVAPAASAAPCGPAEMEGVRAPAQLLGERVGKVESALIAGKRYDIEVAPERANGVSYPLSSPYRQSSAREGSIAVSGSPAVAFTPVRDSGRVDPSYTFAAPRGSPFTLTVTWVQELQAQSGASAGECSATATITLPTFVPKPAVVSMPRFVRHRIRRFFASDDYFAIRVTPGGDPEDPTPVYVVLRMRGGTTRAPSLRSRPVLKRRLDRNISFQRSGLALDSEGIRSVDNGEVEDVTITTYVNNGGLRSARFAFSIEILQGGRRLGGMRGGAVCRIAFSSRAHRYYRACTPVGFRKHA